MVDHGTSQWKDGVELEIFMNVDAPQQQIDDVRIALDELEGPARCKSYKFLTKEDAYNEFQRIFHDQPDLVESTTPEALPTSFRVAPAEAELTEDDQPDVHRAAGCRRSAHRARSRSTASSRSRSTSAMRSRFMAGAVRRRRCS